MPGPLIETIAGAVDFTGVVGGGGFLSFTPDEVEPAFRMKLASVSYNGAAISGPITLDIVRTGGAPTELQPVRRWSSLASGELYIGCDLIVPPGFFVRFVTSGKSGTGTLVIDWYPDFAVSLLRGASG